MLTRLPLAPVELWVSDIVKESTHYKQRARAYHLGIDLYSGVLLLEVRVYAHAVLENGNPGDPLTLNGLPFRAVYLHVDPATGVYFDPQAPTHARTGELLSLRGILSQADWEQQMQDSPLPHAIQSELFGAMLSQQERVTFLLLSEIYRADQLGQFNEVRDPLALGAGF